MAITWGGGATSTQWIEAKDAANHPIAQDRAAPQPGRHQPQLPTEQRARNWYSKNSSWVTNYSSITLSSLSREIDPMAEDFLERVTFYSPL